MQIAVRKLALGLLISLASLIGLVGFFGLESGPVSWLLLKLFHPGPHYYQVAIALEVDGHPVDIVRTIECKPKFAHSERGGSFAYSVAWYPSRYLVSQRLADGSGTMIVVPRGCNKEQPPPPSYVPLVFWTPDATKLESLEGYFDQDRLSRGGYHVKFVRLSFSPATVLTEAPSAEDFADHLNLFGPDPSPIGEHAQFVSLLVLDLRDIGGPSQRDADGITSDGRNLQILSQPVLDPGKIASDLESTASYKFSGAYDRTLPDDLAAEHTKVLSQLGKLVPLQPTDSTHWRLDPSVIGAVKFVRLESSWCNRVGERCVANNGDIEAITDHRPKHYMFANGRLYLQFELYQTLVLRQ